MYYSNGYIGVKCT